MKYASFLYLYLIFNFAYSQKFLPLQNYSKTPFPGVDIVRKNFFNTYSTDNLPADYFTFEKRPMGWFISVRENPELGIRKKSFQFWSAQTKEYLKAPNKEIKDGGKRTSYRSLYPSEIYNYNKNVFYGYKDWSKDVIELLQNEKTLSDDFLNSLARAYTNQTGSILTPHYEFQQGINILYDNNYDPSTISKNSLDSFIYFAKNSIATYKRIIDQNPKYETVVGNVKIKYWNEHMYAYNELMIVQQPELAKEFLKENIYDDFLIITATNLLNSCKPNAILFTGGDSDTYSLIYAQEKLNIRKDVTIVNTSLANLGRYIYYLTDIYSGNKIKLTLSKKDYKNNVNDYCMLNNKTAGMKTTEILEKIKTGELVTYSLFSSYTYMPSSKYSLSTKEYIPDSNYPQNIYALNDSIIFSGYGNYIIKNDLMLLDLVTTNKWQRPIYMASTVSMGGDIFKALQNHMVMEGLCYRLTPFNTNTTNSNNLTVSYEFLKNNYSFKGINKETSKMSGEGVYIDLSLHTFCSLASAYQTTDLAKALEIANLIYENIFPYHVSYEYVELAKIYYKSGEKEKGYKLLLTTYQNYKDQFDPAYTKYMNAENNSDVDTKSMNALMTFKILYDASTELKEDKIINMLKKYKTMGIIEN